MKSLRANYLWILIGSALLAACATVSDTTPLLVTDDCGPKPTNTGEIVAAWFNAHYRYTPPNPVRPEEFSITEPKKVAISDFMMGRKVGWQIILGPENKMVKNFSDQKYTRLIINRGHIVSVTSSDEDFAPAAVASGR
ncbi:MAG: hypothetical protein ABJF10_07000 [Chthoniobacter sp.]|uniref:hypothetical protein n=1 Tax=Chthoniobacter sp. TaxID=2510640 RepID=UPI0032A4F52A